MTAGDGSNIEARRALLIGLLDDSNAGVRRCAAIGLEKLEASEALHQLSDRLHGDNTVERVQAVYALGKVPGDTSLRTIVGLLKDDAEDVRAAAARVLDDLRDPRAVKYLVEALEDTSFTVRGIVADTLGKMKDRKVVPFLISQLGAPADSYVEKVIRALGDLGDPRAEGPLTRFTEHDNPKLRGLAAIALGMLSVTTVGSATSGT